MVASPLMTSRTDFRTVCPDVVPQRHRCNGSLHTCTFWETWLQIPSCPNRIQGIVQERRDVGGTLVCSAAEALSKASILKFVCGKSETSYFCVFECICADLQRWCWIPVDAIKLEHLELEGNKALVLFS